ncbi:hypothetical protein J5Y03_16525 [Bacillus sp. RG28]|uniref:Uncharacterized protein n=1 Tax=Gottfriedia endophytica TaxID=2820819 RepID=A0A940NS21_9BACI|nr:hypothetical protein [Gottfriedia endophytica]MBP0726765.1 hypothetical protein [Gottfriedia endophytica]
MDRFNVILVKYLLGNVMVISGLILLIINYVNPIKEESLVLAWSFVIAGIINLIYKSLKKR